MTNGALRGMPEAVNPHVRFDEGEGASAKPKRGSLLCKLSVKVGVCVIAVMVAFSSVCSGEDAAVAKSRPSVEDELRKLADAMVPIPGKNYALCKYEATQGLWEAVMGEKPPKSVAPDYPVEYVTMRDTLEFLKKLNELDPGHGYRLPAEDEWEHAARAGGKGWFGKLADGREGTADEMVFLVTDTCRDAPRKVGEKMPNAFGLYDMAGNVHEFVTTEISCEWLYRGASCWPYSGSDGWHTRDWGWSQIKGSASEGFRICRDLSDAEREVAAKKAAEIQGAALRELPLTMVPIPGKDYSICKYEVTQILWEAVTGGNPSKGFKSDDMPVNNVSWSDCQAFLAKLNAMSPGHDYRLPTEEWEHACRAGSTGRYGNLPGGREGNLEEMAWYDETADSGSRFFPVGMKKPNAFGLYDMHGNMAEWTSTASNGVAVIRGGDWAGDAGWCEAGRGNLGYTNDCRRPRIGLRLCGTFSAAERESAAKIAAVELEKAAAVEAAIHDEEDFFKEAGDAVLRDLQSLMVKIPGKDFMICKYEVTQGLWAAVMGNVPSKSKGRDLPVESVTMDDCREFLKKLNEMDPGHEYRLPTFDEWVFACRAGATGNFANLADGREGKLDEMAWYYENSGSKPHEVGQLKPNAFGLYDMHGNVNEWVVDVSGKKGNVCGGGFPSFGSYCAADFMLGLNTSYRFESVGFRLCCSAVLTEEESAAMRKAEAEAREALEKAMADALAALPSTMVPIPGTNYCICKYEVTQALWEAVMGENPSRFEGLDNPVNNVSWNDCQVFLKKLNAMSPGHGYRLPTSEEWEYACRAGSVKRYGKMADGSDGDIDDMGWYRDTSGGLVHKVGQLQPNAFGLYDMHGNVCEWTSTAYSNQRIYRGGYWDSNGHSCACGYVNSFRPKSQLEKCGLRLCCDAPASEKPDAVGVEAAMRNGGGI